MLSDIWPVFRLLITTDRLVLRLPNEHEQADLAQVAGTGVHPPSERPFLTPWTEGSAQGRRLSVVRGHWSDLADRTADRWGLGLCVFADGQPIGIVSLRARDFRAVREVTTSSWLGMPFQGRGFGTEARIGLLTLAFDQLEAEADVRGLEVHDHVAGTGRSSRSTRIVATESVRRSPGAPPTRTSPH